MAEVTADVGVVVAAAAAAAAAAVWHLMALMAVPPSPSNVKNWPCWTGIIVDRTNLSRSCSCWPSTLKPTWMRSTDTGVLTAAHSSTTWSMGGGISTPGSRGCTAGAQWTQQLSTMQDQASAGSRMRLMMTIHAEAKAVCMEQAGRAGLGWAGVGWSDTSPPPPLVCCPRPPPPPDVA